jgi:hypothetical protein
MSNANLPDRWLVDRRFRRDQLSDSAYRSYMSALMWAVANRTDGMVEPRDLPHIPNLDPTDIPELIGDDLLELRGRDRGWFISDYPTTQSSRNLLESYERKKAWDRNRKARATAKKHTGQTDSTGNSTGTFPPERLRPTNQPTQTNTEGTEGA